MVDVPLLTIAIPTFNRIETLKILVEKTKPYLCAQITLMIVDNHSTDNTYQYCQDLLKVSNYIIYIRNDVNVGGVVNMLKCIEYSGGEYTWLLGDDDNIEPKYLNELVGHISKTQCMGYHLIPESRKSHKINQYHFEDISQFKNNFYDFTACNLMAANIYQTNEAKKYLIDAYKLVHLQHAFTLFFQKFLKQKDCIEIVSIPILRNEQITTKRWAEFKAHLDAMETSLFLYGREVIKNEFEIRKGRLTKIAFLSFFSKKNQGFTSKEIWRLLRLSGVRALPIAIALFAFVLLSKTKASQYLLVYLLILYYYFRYSNQYREKINASFGIDKKSNLVNELYTRLSLRKTDIFTN